MSTTHQTNKHEWIDSEDASLALFCQIDHFSWGQRFLWEKGTDHGKFNFIRLLDNDINENQFCLIIEEQDLYFREHSKTLHIKISDSIFPTLPKFLGKYKATGSPLISILIRHNLLPRLETQKSISIRECKTANDLESFIRVNASGRGWPLDNYIYNSFRQSFGNSSQDATYYLLCIDEEPACTARINHFGNKFNLGLLATHKDFQRRGLMHYINLWLAEELKKDFYVQVNDDEPSYFYYSKLPGAEIANTEVKYTAE